MHIRLKKPLKPFVKIKKKKKKACFGFSPKPFLWIAF